jgi:hypothetical protein
MQLIEKLKQRSAMFRISRNLFKDITPVFQDPALFGEVVDILVTELRHEKFDVIAVVEERGYPGIRSGKAYLKRGCTLGSFAFLSNLSFLRGQQNLQGSFGVKPYYLISY